MPPLAPLSQPEQNYAQTQGENGGGISDSGDITSTKQQMPPPENDQNHAQNTLAIMKVLLSTQIFLMLASHYFSESLSQKKE